jgi:hypothetical protein
MKRSSGRLIDVIDEQYGTDFKPTDQFFFEQLRRGGVRHRNPALEDPANLGRAVTRYFHNEVVHRNRQGNYRQRRDGDDLQLRG